MNVLLVNGSSRANGCTAVALSEAEKALNEEGIETEMFFIGNAPISDCIACRKCKKTGRCVFNDIVNEFVDKARQADGFFFGSPVYFAHPAGRILSFMDRAFYSNGAAFAFKPAAAVLSARRAGTTASFDVLNEEWAESALKATFFSSITNPSTRFVNSVVYAIVALSGALSALTGRISIGALTSALSYANQYTKPFNEISGVVTELQNALVSAMRVFALIEEKGESEDSTQLLVVSSGEVIFDNISFSYEKDKPLIKDFSLSVRGGEHIAIVGPTGAGKTTLINLLMRFYDVDEGCIRIDGSSIDSVSRKSLRSAFGMVLQDTYILHASVWENIDLGRGFSEDAIREAARKAHADTFINRLENGYDTLLSDEGAALSAGERQLLCIARIMLSLPSILLLDEATSSIDTRTEALIQSSFMTLMDKRTSFVVAHRLSTIERSDVILVLRDGNIVEMGNHKELLAKRGFYKELFDSQFC